MRSFRRINVMVSKECTRGARELSAPFAEIGGAGHRQLKIYGKSNDSSFRQIEGSENTQVLRGSGSERVDCEFDRNGIDGVCDVLSASHGLLADGRVRAVAARQIAGF